MMRRSTTGSRWPWRSLHPKGRYESLSEADSKSRHESGAWFPTSFAANTDNYAVRIRKVGLKYRVPGQRNLCAGVTRTDTVQRLPRQRRVTLSDVPKLASRTLWDESISSADLQAHSDHAMFCDRNGLRRPGRRAPGVDTASRIRAAFPTTAAAAAVMVGGAPEETWAGDPFSERRIACVSNSWRTDRASTGGQFGSDPL